MEIKGKVHCFFEQSGVFKNAFKALGYDAYDYDIQDHFGQTDCTDDLFKAIDDAYAGKPSLFDRIVPDDLIVAFYPCIYFSCVSQMAFTLGCINYRKLSDVEKIGKIIERNRHREEFYERLLRFVSVCLSRNLRMVFENPWAEQTYLKANFLKKPDVVDMNRSLRGDARIKPTAYWFWNCTPTEGFTYEPYESVIYNHNELKGSGKAGLCSEERSMITPAYARNWINDFILGKPSGFKPKGFGIALKTPTKGSLS